MAAQNYTKLLKSKAITHTVVGTTPLQKFVPTFGAVSTDTTVTYTEGTAVVGGPVTTNSLITIKDDLVTKYDKAAG